MSTLLSALVRARMHSRGDRQGQPGLTAGRSSVAALVGASAAAMIGLSAPAGDLAHGVRRDTGVRRRRAARAVDARRLRRAERRGAARRSGIRLGAAHHQGAVTGWLALPTGDPVLGPAPRPRAAQAVVGRRDLWRHPGCRCPGPHALALRGDRGDGARCSGLVASHRMDRPRPRAAAPSTVFQGAQVGGSVVPQSMAGPFAELGLDSIDRLSLNGVWGDTPEELAADGERWAAALTTLHSGIPSLARRRRPPSAPSRRRGR